MEKVIAAIGILLLISVVAYLGLNSNLNPEVAAIPWAEEAPDAPQIETGIRQSQEIDDCVNFNFRREQEHYDDLNRRLRESQANIDRQLGNIIGSTSSSKAFQVAYTASRSRHRDRCEINTSYVWRPAS